MHYMSVTSIKWTEDNYTSHQYNGSSVIDYAITSETLRSLNSIFESTQAYTLERFQIIV